MHVKAPAGATTRSHVFPESAVRLHLGSANRTFLRGGRQNSGLAQLSPRRASSRVEEADVHDEIFGVRRRIRSPPKNLGSSSPRHVSATTGNLFASSSWRPEDFGRLDAFCSPRQLRGSRFTQSATLRGAVTLAARRGLMDGGEGVRRTEIFSTPRRIRGASPEVINLQRSRSAEPIFFSSGADADTVTVDDCSSADGPTSRRYGNSCTDLTRTIQHEEHSISEASGVPIDSEAEATTTNEVDSPRTLRKAVPGYRARYEANLSGSTLGLPACEAWRSGAILGSPGLGSGYFCTHDSYPVKQREETWRVLLTSLYRQPLPPDVRKILQDFELYAKELEKSVLEQLSTDRFKQRETWQKQRQSTRLKPSAQLLKLRVVEKRLAKSQQYSEAARIKREADRQEEIEMLEHENDSNDKMHKLDIALREHEFLTKSKLQNDLYERLWQHVLNDDVPAPKII